MYSFPDLEPVYFSMSSSNCCFLTCIQISQESGQAEYYSAIKKNTFESVLMRWMKLEPIIQSEACQKEKHQYSILTHIYGIYKDGNDDPQCETAKETQMYQIRSDQISQSCLTLCDPMNCSTPGLPVHHQLPEFTQTHVHRVSDAIQPSHPQSSPSPPAPNPSQHQSLFQ